MSASPDTTADLARWSLSSDTQALLENCAGNDPEVLAALAVEIVEFIGSEFRRLRQGQGAASMSDGSERSEVLGVATKSSATDPVTVMDTLFEANIREILREVRPSDALLGEEQGGQIESSGVTWIADPVDGTVNLLYGLPLSAVSLGVAIDGEFVAGAVHALGLAETYTAYRGGGARMRSVSENLVDAGVNSSDSTQPWRSLSVTDCASSAQALIATGFSYDAEVRRQQGEVVAKLLPQVRDIRRLGAAALDLCLLAAGRIDGYYERELKVWDYAAGVVIVSEAGGQITMPREEEPLIAAGPNLFSTLTALLSQ